MKRMTYLNTSYLRNKHVEPNPIRETARLIIESGVLALILAVIVLLVMV